MAETPVLQVTNLKAYYQMDYFGVTREVRAVDDITMTIRNRLVLIIFLP